MRRGPPAARDGHAGRVAKGMLACLLLFLCGSAMDLALRQGFYANAVLAGLVGAWLAASLAWLRMRPPPLPSVVPPSPPRPDPDSLRLRTMLDQVPVPLLLLSSHGLLHAQNRAARALFATDGRVPHDLPQLRAALSRLQPGERGVVGLPPPGAPGQPERMFALTVAHSTASDGVTRLVVLTDIQAEMQAAEAAALRDLLGVLSHEIMNSLTPVTSLADTARALLADGTPDDLAAAADALETIGRRARGLDRFVAGYRMMARLPPPVPRPIALTSLLSDARALFEARLAGGDVALTLALPPAEIMIRIDPDLTMQALLNLLANAAEAARSGAQPRRIGLSGQVENGRAVIRVADSGAGVAAVDREAIFRPFFTSRPDGTGLGLGLARQIAQSQGGSLVLEAPQQGTGAVFRLEL